MKNWQDNVVHPHTPLRDAIECIDRSGQQIALVVDHDGRLAGVLSDGDVRRAVLRGLDLSLPTSLSMNRTPTTASISASPAELLALMRRSVLRHLPLLNEAGCVVGLSTLESLLGSMERPNAVVLMVGGMGTRLMPLTRDCPKPMLPVGGKPILESILESFHEQGFRRFFFSVNYLAQAFKDHFGDGSRWGVDIQYLHEDKRLGTAGALSLLPNLPDEPLLVMNGDLLTRVRFDNLLDFHVEHRALATMAVREYDFQVPYGVVRLDGAKIMGIEEKPVQRFFVNAGIYVLSPQAVSMIPRDTFFDMPSLFEQLMQTGWSTAAYPLREYWLDIGRIEEFERAQREWVNEEPNK
jgi:dTDP-glucose pyrophosphorylase/CBS domain-containing protein